MNVHKNQSRPQHRNFLILILIVVVIVIGLTPLPFH